MIGSRAARTVRHVPSRFTSIVRSKAAGSMARTEPNPESPAFAITTSRPPSRSTVSATAPSIGGTSVMSASNHTAPRPHAAAVSSSRSGSSPTRESRAPAAARRFALRRRSRVPRR
jgi:hypothetical protein